MSDFLSQIGLNPGDINGVNPGEIGLDVGVVTTTPTATYDLTTPLGQVRFHAADTDVYSPIWTDLELLYCLALTGNDPMLAAAMALRAAATDAAKLAVMVAHDQLKHDLRSLPDALRQAAADLEQQAVAFGGGPVVASNDAVFTLDSALGLGSMHEW